MKDILRYKNVIAAVVVIIIFIFVIKSTIEKHYAVMKILEAQKLELENGKKLINNWQETNRQIRELADKFFAKDTSQFKTFVEQQAQSSGITVNSLVPSKQKKDFYLEVTISIKGTPGAYEDIVKFIKSLEDKNITTEMLRVSNDLYGNQRKRNIEITLKSFLMKD
ncbi:MAG: hypothetical protein Q8O30_02705 [Candidatus Omnitrophota bacterium]|nr:hypothetical protein [Candidatus Omnitrophota bacterium]